MQRLRSRMLPAMARCHGPTACFQCPRREYRMTWTTQRFPASARARHRRIVCGPSLRRPSSVCRSGSDSAARRVGDGRRGSSVSIGDSGTAKTSWQAMGGMEVGSIWGHGSYVAPDWTADYLHREATSWTNTGISWGRSVATRCSAETRATLLERLRARCAPTPLRDPSSGTSWSPSAEALPPLPPLEARTHGQPFRRRREFAIRGKYAAARRA